MRECRLRTENTACAVLLRSAEIIDDDVVKRAARRPAGRRLRQGAGNLGKALGIELSDNGPTCSTRSRRSAWSCGAPKHGRPAPRRRRQSSRPPVAPLAPDLPSGLDVPPQPPRPELHRRRSRVAVSLTTERIRLVCKEIIERKDRRRGG